MNERCFSRLRTVLSASAAGLVDLQDEPFIHHQTILMPFVVILLHQRIAARQLGGNAAASAASASVMLSAW
jgi:hypothetical protein